MDKTKDDMVQDLKWTRSLIGHEHATLQAAMELCKRIVARQDYDSTDNRFKVREAMAEMFYAMHLQLAKDGGAEDVVKMFEEILEIRWRKVGEKANAR